MLMGKAVKMTEFILYQDKLMEDMGTRPEYKFSFKVMVWIGVNFSGLTQVFILPQKTTLDSDFYVEKLLPIVKRDEIKLIEDNFIFQQDGAKPHTSGQTMEVFQ